MSLQHSRELKFSEELCMLAFTSTVLTIGTVAGAAATHYVYERAAVMSEPRTELSLIVISLKSVRTFNMACVWGARGGACPQCAFSHPFWQPPQVTRLVLRTR